MEIETMISRIHRAKCDNLDFGRALTKTHGTFQGWWFFGFPEIKFFLQNEYGPLKLPQVHKEK